MNRIYKVIYSKVRQCYVVVSEIAKSHGRHTKSSVAKSSSALTAAVLIALGAFSFEVAFSPMTAEAADKTRTDGSNFVGVERTNGLLDESKYENSGGKGAQGADSITLGLKAQAGAGTITIGDRNAGASLGSVYVGQGDIAKPKLDTGGWATSIGYNSDATGYGSIALGSNAVAKNSYAKDSKGESLVYQQTYVENGEQKVRLVAKPDIQRASVAIGYGASADNGNIAIGSYSDASTDLRTAKTPDDKEIKSYLTDKKADSYVSVGKSDALRRISNVADGAADSDVATIAQLREVTTQLNAATGSGFHFYGTKDTDVKKTDMQKDTDINKDVDLNNYNGGGAAGEKTVAIGSKVVVTGDRSNSVGYANTVKGTLSDVYGNGNTIAKDTHNAVVLGNSNKVGSNSVAIGTWNKEKATNSVFIGGDDVSTTEPSTGDKTFKDWAAVTKNADGTYTFEYRDSIKEDTSTTSDPADDESQGAKRNTFTDEEDSWGENTASTSASAKAASASAFSTNGSFGPAIGFGDPTDTATAAIDKVTAVGKSADASGEGSVSLGYGAKSNNGNIAIGYNSQATEKLSSDKKGYLTDTAAPAFYASVGDGKDNSAAKYRRITNVADGSDEQDAVTVAQLKKQETKLTSDLSVKAGWGINKADVNTISVKHNLSTGSNAYADTDARGLILGGSVSERKDSKQYGASTETSVIVGAGNALASGAGSVVAGGLDNVASGANSTVVGGDNNNATASQSAVFGGRDNTASGITSTASGGIMNVANGQNSTAVGGTFNYALGTGSTSVGGYGKDYATGHDSSVNGSYSVGIAGGSTGDKADYSLAAGRQAVVTTENGTAVGYQATTDESGTISFGHDAGDVSGYTVTWKQRTDGKTNADHTTNDYTQVPNSVTPTTYKDAYYNRLVKVADGVDDHDVVVMEQLKQYAEKDALNLGNNIKVYMTDEKGNVQLDKDKNPVEDKNATTNAQNKNKNAWGQALGAGMFTSGTSNAATNASTSDQLVTGKTLYNYDAPVAETGKTLNYVSANNTTGQNLSALDAQVKANADTLKDKTHNIKYYSVDESLPKINGYTNEGNDGAKGMGSLAAGFNTHADGIASTVAGSYSSVINTGDVKLMGYDFRGATALSYGTFNSNQSTAQSGVFSGVANSIVGQANMTTDSNAAIIYGAGNTITNSYRDIDISKFDLSKVKQDIAKKDAAAVAKDLQEAVSTSGGQVMVMGGGNSVDKAYMTQVVGVGNKVTGHDTTYAEGTSTQYNYVDGFQNTLTNGKNDYIIGANNSVTGDSIDKNQSNIVVGDNHTLNNEKNNVVLGSADSSKELAASGAVVIGHNADVSVDGGVALGSDSVASVKEGQKGYDPAEKVTNKTTAPWTSTKAAVSVGKADGSVTRQITGVAAGTEDTDAVNVAQIKKLASVDASNIGKNIKDGDVTTNENAWGEALGTGTVTKDNKQLVTGKTVYDALHGGLDNITVGKDGQNGKDGSIGIAGQNGKDGYTMTIIKTEKGADSVDGKNGQDGITRIVYQDKDDNTGKTKQTVATLDDGLKFMDDFGTTAKVKLDNVLNVVGDINQGVEDESKKKTADALSTGNIGVVATDTTYKDDGTVETPGKLTIKLAKDLKGMNSTEYTSEEKPGEGDQQKTTTTINSRGLTITDGPSITKDGIDAGNKAITQVASGLGKDSQGSYNKEQNGTNAANLNDVNKMITDATGGTGTIGKELAKKANVDASNIGKNYKDGDATANEIAWGDAIGTGTVTKDDNGSKQLVTGGTVYKALHDGGLDKIVIGTPGKDGTAGTPGTIGLVGPAGKDGKNTEVDITIQQGKDDADKGIKGQNGVDGKDGITRIVYGDGDDQHQVATLDDGLVFAGDTGANAAVKLNHQVKLSGTTFDDSNKYDEHNWTSDNIAVVSDKTDANGDAVLKLQLAKDLKGMNSTEYTSEEKPGEGDQQKTTTTINSRGLTITDGPSITKDGIDAGNKAITQVASGLGKDSQGSYNKEQNGTNAANLNDVNKMITDATGGTGTIGKELAKKANVDASNIGKNYKDGDATANEIAWGDAIGTGTVTKDDNGSKQLVTGGTVYKALHDGGLDKIVIGTPGKDGTAGTPGTIGLVGPAGKDGKNTEVDITIQQGKDDADKGIKGQNGVDGKDGITRIVYGDGDDQHQVATLDDGLVFAGDTGANAAVKLNHQVKLSGTTFDDSNKYDEHNWTSDNIAVVSDKTDANGDAVLKLQLAKDLKGMNSTEYTSEEKPGEGDQQKTTTTINSKGLTITDGPSITKDGIDAGNKAITQVASGLGKDSQGSYNKEQNGTNAANLNDVNKMITDATGGTGTIGKELAKKANVDASNIGKNYKDGDATANEIAWGDAIGTGTVTKDDNGSKQLVTGGTVYKALHDGGLDKIVIGTPGKDGTAGTPGTIGLVGPAGKDGKNTEVDITIQQGKDDADKGIKGQNGVDGKDGITRIVYGDGDDQHQVATLDDGLVFAGDTGANAAVKLNHQVKLSGTTFDDSNKYDEHNWTSDNIAVVSDKTDANGDAVLKLQLAKDLKGMNSTEYTSEEKPGEGDQQKTTTTINSKGLTITDGPSITKDGIDAGNKAITKVASGLGRDSQGSYNKEQNGTNAANLNDVNKMITDATGGTGTIGKELAKKANVDASNIGKNYKDGDATANEIAWGDAIGTGKIEKDNGQLVTGKTVYDEVRPKENGNYVKTNQTTGENLSALDSKIGKLDETKKYNYLDSGKNVSISNNLTKLDTQVKNNADAIKENSKSIQDITNNVKNLSNNAVQYDEDSNKSKVTLAGKDGTTITNVKDGALNDSSTDAVNGKQLYAEQTARKELETKVTSNTTEINNIKDGQGFTDKGKEVIRDLAKGSVKVIAGTNTTVTPGTDEDGATTYAVNVEGNGKVASGDTNLISGGTLYNEVHVTTDGSYIKSSQTVGQNLSSLDSGLKTTSDLIHTNTAGDTIQIGGNSTATKVDISGKDKDGNKTGRVITGVVSDANDPNSAANVGYVNGITSASNEQIYRDMNMQYNHVENDISRAAAGSNALAALHPMQEFDPDDKAQYALGYGHYRNSNAGAVGVFYQPDENSLFSLGASFGNGDAGINAGVTFKFGPGGSGHHALTKTQMAKVIDAQSKEIDALKKDNADKDKRIDALEQKVNEILAKVEKDKA